jgi:NAD(P)-dependent dehydrogenase (short-subunit alcohol dehydrogenase family)
MATDPMRLDGRVAVVTGAAQGIGAAIARVLAAAGARVVIGDLQDASGVVAEIAAQGGDAAAVIADVSDREQVESLLEQTVARFGALDVLVNNAGIDAPPGNAWDLPIGEWDRTISVNLTGAFHCSQAAAQRMMTASGGSIVNISSHVAWLGVPGTSPAYHASKGGMIGLTVAFAAQLAEHHIRVNAIAPGAIMSRDFGWSESERAGHERMYALGLGEPDDVAHAVRYLSSPAARWVTGTILYINGGFRRGGPLL